MKLTLYRTVLSALNIIHSIFASVALRKSVDVQCDYGSKARNQRIGAPVELRACMLPKKRRISAWLTAVDCHDFIPKRLDRLFSLFFPNGVSPTFDIPIQFHILMPHRITVIFVFIQVHILRVSNDNCVS